MISVFRQHFHNTQLSKGILPRHLSDCKVPSADFVLPMFPEFSHVFRSNIDLFDLIFLRIRDFFLQTDPLQVVVISMAENVEFVDGLNGSVADRGNEYVAFEVAASNPFVEASPHLHSYFVVLLAHFLVFQHGPSITRRTDDIFFQL